MNPLSPSADLLAAPEFLHIHSTLAVLDALETCLRIEHTDIDDYDVPPDSLLAPALAVLRAITLLRRQLHGYQRATRRLFSSSPHAADDPF